MLGDLALLAHLASADHKSGVDVVAQGLVRRPDIIKDRVLFVLRGTANMKSRLALDRLLQVRVACPVEGARLGELGLRGNALGGWSKFRRVLTMIIVTIGDRLVDLKVGIFKAAQVLRVQFLKECLQLVCRKFSVAGVQRLLVVVHSSIHLPFLVDLRARLLALLNS